MLIKAWKSGVVNNSWNAKQIAVVTETPINLFDNCFRKIPILPTLDRNHFSFYFLSVPVPPRWSNCNYSRVNSPQRKTQVMWLHPDNIRCLSLSAERQLLFRLGLSKQEIARLACYVSFCPTSGWLWKDLFKLVVNIFLPRRDAVQWFANFRGFCSLRRSKIWLLQIMMLKASLKQAKSVGRRIL